MESSSFHRFSSSVRLGRPRIGRFAPILLALTAIAACGSGGDRGRAISTASFAAQPNQQVQPDAQPGAQQPLPDIDMPDAPRLASPQPRETVVLAQPGARVPRVIDIDEARGAAGYLPPSDGAGAAPPMFDPTDRSTARMLVNAKVGDINGRPVFAGEFLDPLEPVLTAAAANPQVERSAWLAEAERLIRQQLLEQIEGELLRAEAVSTLAPGQQRFGLGALLDRLREGARREAGGNLALARQRIEQEQGIGFDEYLEAQRDEQLVRFLLQQRIDRRVAVSWREIKQEYEARRDEFNPNPRAIFRTIRARRSEAADVAMIANALAAGQPFAEVASLPANGSNPEQGGLFIFEFEGELRNSNPFLQEDLNAAAVTLEPGEIAGPIEDDRFVRWVTLEQIAQVSVPLYEAQLFIDSVRRQELRREEFVRYFESLRDKASYTDTEIMVDRLVEIAEERFFAGASGDPS